MDEDTTAPLARLRWSLARNERMREMYAHIVAAHPLNPRGHSAITLRTYHERVAQIAAEIAAIEDGAW